MLHYFWRNELNKKHVIVYILITGFWLLYGGHVQRVYQVAWSADSRLLCSGSADSTLKVWDVKTKKLLFDLPGHADEVCYEQCHFTKLEFFPNEVF